MTSCGGTVMSYAPEMMIGVVRTASLNWKNGSPCQCQSSMRKEVIQRIWNGNTSISAAISLLRDQERGDPEDPHE